MEQQQVEKYRIWFDDYVAGFYGDDQYVNANLKLKVQHSRRTCDEMLYLVEELTLPANQRRIAEVISLFHDIGRFRQFVKYGTYNDVKSVNHCLLSLDVLRETRVLEPIDEQERQFIEEAIKYHGLVELPADLDGQCLLFSQLIRDADKLDVFYTVTEYYEQYRDNPGKFMLEVEFPDKPYCSAHLVELILSEQLIDYSDLQTWNDMKLLQLGWVYDVNFVPTLKRLKQRGFLEKIVEFLPASRDVEKVKEKIFGYVDARIAQAEAKE